MRPSFAASLAALLLAACSAGVPPTGKVVSVNPVPPPTEPIPSLNGSDPQPGLSETDVAKGYMYAMADEDPTRAARWVVPGKARQLVEHWSQRTPVNVYDSLEPKAPGVKLGARIAPIQVSRVGRLEHGRDWTPDTGDQTIDLELHRSGSEWRVANPQERWIDLTSFKRLYGPVDLFLVAGDGQHLAPVSGFLQRPPLGATAVASLEQRTAGALRWLLDGPQGRVARALRTAIPRGTQLRDVSYRDGVATVNLSGRFAAPDEGLSGKLRVGQVVWTVSPARGRPRPSGRSAAGCRHRRGARTPAGCTSSRTRRATCACSSPTCSTGASRRATCRGCPTTCSRPRSRSARTGRSCWPSASTQAPIPAPAASCSSAPSGHRGSSAGSRGRSRRASARCPAPSGSTPSRSRSSPRPTSRTTSTSCG